MITKITIEGMGGCINFEMKLIQKVLEDAGLHVFVTNNAADWECSRSEDYVDYVIKHNLKLKADGNPNQIDLIAKHIPWGG